MAIAAMRWTAMAAALVIMTGLTLGGCASSGDGMMKKDDAMKKDDQMMDKK